LSESATLHHANAHAADRRDRFSTTDGPERFPPLGIGTTKNGCGKTGGAGEREAEDADAWRKDANR
jgi:hypothetical protein